MTPEIEEFAKVLVEKVRDAAIQSNERTLDAQHVIAKRALIPDVVDSTISHLLGAIDQELLRLSFTAPNGKSVDLTKVSTESGELSGWYRGAGGWCEKYSKERVIDDFADLTNFFDKPPDGDHQSAD
jgi:hypothetical protein